MDNQITVPWGNPLIQLILNIFGGTVAEIKKAEVK